MLTRWSTGCISKRNVLTGKLWYIYCSKNIVFNSHFLITRVIKIIKCCKPFFQNRSSLSNYIYRFLQFSNAKEKFSASRQIQKHNSRFNMHHKLSMYCLFNISLRPCVVDMKYHQTSYINHTKSQNLNVSNLVLEMTLPNPLKPGVKLRMKTLLGQRRQVMLQLHLSDQHFIAC